MQGPSKNPTTPEKEDTSPSSPPRTTTPLVETVPATLSGNASPAAFGAASGGGVGGGFIGENIRIPWQLMEVTSGGGSGGEGGAHGVPALGGLVEKTMDKPAVQEGGSSSSKGKQKRKGSELKDPPSGNPICPECGREFASWKSVFGHLRVHSGRSYTGLYPPPVSPPRQPPQGDQEASRVKAGGEEEGNTGTIVFGFDLNKPVEGSIAAEASPSNAEKNDDAGENSAAKFQFDLNQLPAAEEDDDDTEEQG